jgi:hypothetical protein
MPDKTSSACHHQQAGDTQGMSLVGRCFHVFGADRKVRYQGVVRGMVSPTHALVQYFEWLTGAPNTMEVVWVERMARGATATSREPGSWQFYEDTGHMIAWYASHRDVHA